MSQIVVITMLVSVIRLSVPVIITGLGNMFSEKAGIQNLGAEGMMISGAFGAAVISYFTGSAWLGVLGGIMFGAVIGFLHGLISVQFGGVQNISGLGLNMLAAGLTSFLCRSFFSSGYSPKVDAIQSTKLLEGIPVFGEVLSQFSPIVYIMVVLIFICWYIMKKTTLGLRITAVGDDPQTVETAGINVWRMRHICVVVCGCMAGLAGAYLAVGQLNIFVEGMTKGKGMLAVIAVKMGRWDPKRIVIVAVMFGFFDALQLQLQISNALGVPTEITQLIPYVVAIAALALDSTATTAPMALRVPYVKNKFKL